MHPMAGEYLPNTAYEARATWNPNSPAVQMAMIPGMRMEFGVTFRTDGNGRPYGFKDSLGVGNDPHPDDLDIISFAPAKA